MSEGTRELAKVETERDFVPAHGQGFLNWLDPKRFEHVQRIAKVFAESEMVPMHYRKKVGDCIIGIQMAFRMDVDPFMFLQNTYVVHGKPGMLAALAIALINTRGPFAGLITWRFSGTPGTDDWTCTASATLRATGAVCEVPLSWKTVKAEGWLGKEGSKWKTIPEQMFRYRTATFLARLYCPECLMGMQTVEELRDVVDVQATDVSVEPTSRTEALAKKLKDGKAPVPAPAPAPALPTVAEPTGEFQQEPDPEPEPEPPAEPKAEREPGEDDLDEKAAPKSAKRK
jgi:hypothetical protein